MKTNREVIFSWHFPTQSGVSVCSIRIHSSDEPFSAHAPADPFFLAFLSPSTLGHTVPDIIKVVTVNRNCSSYS